MKKALDENDSWNGKQEEQLDTNHLRIGTTGQGCGSATARLLYWRFRTGLKIKKLRWKPDIVAYTFNPSNTEADADRSQ